MFSRHLICLALLALAAAPSLSARADESPRPNVLLIICDQLRAQSLGCMGDPDVKTPEIDRLASEGLLLRRTFANSPVCCPARAIMLTGQYAHKNGMVANDLRLRESSVTLAKLLKADGYQTALIGKWHLDGGPRDPGFVPPGPRRLGFDFWAAYECRHDAFHPLWFRDDPEPVRSTKFEPEALTDVAIDFLKNRKEGPFFLELSIGPPHDPYGAPEKYTKMYDPQKLTMRPNWKEGVPQAGREQIAAYDASVTAIDDQVGRLMRTLKDLDLEKNTIVLFTADHGDMLGSQGARLKRKPWEESIRVPGVLRWPGRVKAGRTTDALFSHVDFAPTLLSLCGVKPPAEMQGTDLSRLVLGQTDQGPESAFFQIFVPFDGDGTPFGWRGVRTARYMYARSEKAPWVLYDLDRDPDELHNLAADAAAESVRADMEARLAKWMKDTGDSWHFDSDVKVDDKGRLTRFQAFYTIDEYLKWATEHPDLAPKD